MLTSTWRKFGEQAQRNYLVLFSDRAKISYTCQTQWWLRAPRERIHKNGLWIGASRVSWRQLPDHNLVGRKALTQDTSSHVTVSNALGAEKTARCIMGWGSILCVNYIQKCFYKLGNKDSKKRFKTIHRQKIDVSHLLTFGCSTFVHMRKAIQYEKLTPGAKVGIFPAIDGGDVFWIFVDKPSTVNVFKEVAFNESGPNTDTTHNKLDQFISFSLPGR